MSKQRKTKPGALPICKTVNKVLWQLLSAKIHSVTVAEKVLREGGEGGLHQFRVALRRLRTLLRAYRPQFDPGMKIRGQLSTLASSTNQARDLEVLVGWIESEQVDSGISAEILAAVVANLRTLDASDPVAGVDGTAISKRWARTSKKLSKRILKAPRDASVRFNLVTSDLIKRQSDELLHYLRLIQTAEDVAENHKARIAAKRLRYILEPLRGAVEQVTPLLPLLTCLQDELGVLNDRAVFVERLEQYYRELSTLKLARSVTQDRDPAAGDFQVDYIAGAVLQLTDRAGVEHRVLFDQFHADWDSRLVNLAKQISRVVIAMINDN